MMLSPGGLAQMFTPAPEVKRIPNLGAVERGDRGDRLGITTKINGVAQELATAAVETSATFR
jgi:hypothetical protein